jgi:hypothetical protein
MHYPVSYQYFMLVQLAVLMSSALAQPQEFFVYVCTNNAQ